MDWSTAVEIVAICLSILAAALGVAYKVGRFERALLAMEASICAMAEDNLRDHETIGTRLASHSEQIGDHETRVSRIEGGLAG